MKHLTHPVICKVASSSHLRYFIACMTMTFDIPSDVQASVSSIPGLDIRVALYLRHEAQLEAVRRQRHSTEARAIAERAVRQAEHDLSAGFDWERSFEALQQKHQDITSKL